LEDVEIEQLDRGAGSLGAIEGDLKRPSATGRFTERPAQSDNLGLKSSS
jgi:hypothetical protein